MDLRRTNVDWDPTLIRVEYLDDKGQPYYCSFERNDDGPAMEVPPEEAPADTAGRTFRRKQLS
jgi:hypothetical protein